MKAIASFWQIYQLIRLIKLSQCGRSPWKSFRVITLPENQRQWRGRGWQYYSPTTFFAWINNSPMARPFYLDANPTWKDMTSSLVRALESCFILTTIIYDYQEKKMAALSGKPLANLTKETLTKMCIDQSFDVFYPITLPARAKAWLAIQRLQENDALRPGWRLVS